MPLPALSTRPVERRLLRDVVYERLSQAILDGTLEPGEVLVDETLTSWLGVSRTPIREALMRLAELGLVEFSPNRYTRVAPLDPRRLLEAAYTTGLLDEHATRHVAPGLSDEQVARLTSVSDSVAEAAATSNPAELARRLRSFFLELETATGNTALLAACQSLAPQLLRYAAIGSLPVELGEIAERVEQIARAAHDRAGDLAGDLVRALYAPVRAAALESRRSLGEEVGAAHAPNAAA